MKFFKSILKKKPKPVVSNLKLNTNTEIVKVPEIKEFISTKKGTLIKSDVVKKVSPEGRVSLKKYTQKKTEIPDYTYRDLQQFLERENKIADRYYHNIIDSVKRTEPYLREVLLSKGITLQYLKSKGFKLRDMNLVKHYPLEELAQVYGKENVLEAYLGDLLYLAREKGMRKASKIYGAGPFINALIKEHGGKTKFVRSMDESTRTGVLNTIIEWTSPSETLRFFEGIKGIVNDFGLSRAIDSYGSKVITSMGGIKMISQKYSFFDIIKHLDYKKRRELMQHYGPELIKAYGLPEINKRLDLSDSELKQIMSRKK